MEIRGADDVEALVKALREHADAKALRRELYRGLNGVSKEIRAEMVETIPDALPRRGGLAAEVQAATRARSTAKGGRYAGVSIRFQARGKDVRVLTGKRLRHPVFGNRGAWVEQEEGVNPDVFPAAFEKQAPKVLAEMQQVLEEVARKVTNT